MDCNYLNHKEEFVELRTVPKVKVICCYYEDCQRVYGVNRHRYGSAKGSIQMFLGYLCHTGRIDQLYH